MSSNVLNVMRHQEKRKFQIHRDIIKDCEGALNVCKGLCRPSNSSCLQGFIQRIDLVPFSLFLTSDIQVIFTETVKKIRIIFIFILNKIKMWLFIQNVNAIWHIDATGNILQPISGGHKSTLLYSIVSYDPQNHKNIPLFEFFTNSQSVVQISILLFLVKEYCLRYKKLGGQKIRFAYAPIITSDFSYILINSILKVFNDCNMEYYLAETFRFLVENTSSKLNINVMIYLCSTHFLHSFIKKV